MELHELRVTHFSPLVGRPFAVKFVDGEIPLTLSEANDLGWSRPGQRNAFSLVFHGPAKPVMPQRMYRLASADLGELSDVFLVPLGPDEKGMRYEVIFT